jgi:Fe-S oxidoreductase
MGRIGEWAPLAARIPGLVNALSNTRVLKRMAGVAAERALPSFAGKTFRSAFKSDQRGEPVVLFDDSFNNHFRPATAAAAQKLLEAAGFAVELPRSHLCCGRPYYDFGLLDRAKATLRRVLDTLAPQLERGLPVVVLEPGCLSVFRDELHQLFKGEPSAERLANNATSLSELLNRTGFKVEMRGKVLMHAHCHQKALWGTSDDVQLMRNAGVDLLTPDTGCCGMAGSFGYSKDHYEVSRQIGERRLLPAARELKPGDVLAAAGTSCRHQVAHFAGVEARHPAVLLHSLIE